MNASPYLRIKSSLASIIGCLVLGSMFLLGGTGCAYKATATEKPIVAVPAPLVNTANPERRTVQRTLELPGDVKPYQEARLYAKVAGYLRSVLVDKGDRVRAGQLLAAIESPEMRLEGAQMQEKYRAVKAQIAGNAASRERAISELRQMQAAQAKVQSDVAVARAQLVKAAAERDVAAADYQKAIEQQREAQAGLDLNRQTYRRLKSIYDRDPGLLARQDLDIARAREQESEAKVAAAQQAATAANSKLTAAESAIEVAREQINAVQHQIEMVKAQVNAARSQVKAIEAQERIAVYQSQASWQAVQQAKGMLEYTEIRSPFAGTITERLLDPGALVQSAASSAQGATKPVLNIASFDTVRIFVQVPEPEVPYVHPGSRVTVRADTLSGRLFPARVTRIARALDSNTRTMLVEIDLPNRSHLLQPGMFVKVNLDLEARANALTVPTSAVVFDKDKRTVFIVENGKAKKISVKTGFEGPEWIEIVEGLTGKEDVIVTGKENVTGGGAVQVAKASR